MATKIEIRCDEELKVLLKKYAERRGVNMTTYVKDAIFEKMKRDERKVKK